MLEFLFDYIFVVIWGKVFQQIVGIPMGTNCAPLPADIFLYSYESEFIQVQSLLSAGKKQLASQFNFTCRCSDDVLWIKNPNLYKYLGQMYTSRWAWDKTRLWAAPLLPSWIYSCRSGGTVSCALPLMTNAVISTFISQTFFSRVAILHLRQPMVSLSHIYTLCKGLLLLWMLLSECGAIFM